jgi:hypothetical protein
VCGVRFWAGGYWGSLRVKMFITNTEHCPRLRQKNIRTNTFRLASVYRSVRTSQRTALDTDWLVSISCNCLSITYRTLVHKKPPPPPPKKSISCNFLSITYRTLVHRKQKKNSCNFLSITYRILVHKKKTKKELAVILFVLLIEL